MNDFSNTNNGGYNLKNDYKPDPVGDALKRKRKKLKKALLDQKNNQNRALGETR